MNKKGGKYFYPARVPWCTARILIGLGLCGRNVENSEPVQKIAKWLLEHPNYSDGRWQSGTGEWNIWLETTALTVRALLLVGISPQKDRIQKAIKNLYDARSEWIQER